MFYMKRDVELGAQIFDKILIAVRFSATEVEVTVNGSARVACLHEHVEESYAIGATADCDED